MRCQWLTILHLLHYTFRCKKRKQKCFKESKDGKTREYYDDEGNCSKVHLNDNGQWVDTKVEMDDDQAQQQEEEEKEKEEKEEEEEEE